MPEGVVVTVAADTAAVVTMVADTAVVTMVDITMVDIAVVGISVDCIQASVLVDIIHARMAITLPITHLIIPLITLYG